MLCCDQETCWYNFKDILPSSKGNFFLKILIKILSFLNKQIQKENLCSTCFVLAEQTSLNHR